MQRFSAKPDMPPSGRANETGIVVPGKVPHPFLSRLKPRSRIVRESGGLPESLGRIGNLEVRLALTRSDIRRAQRLRFKVFFNEMSAKPDARAFISRRDIDPYDRICDHILVIDHQARSGRFNRVKPKVVGTYRVLRSDVARAHHSDFYTAGEYDLAPLLTANPDARMLELGRSCVHKNYRNKRTVELLWHGVWRYILHHRIELMFGCASLEGINPDQHALALGFLHYHARSPEQNRVKALPWRYQRMDRIGAESIDLKAAMKTLPPLIKGYLRLGATFGDGAVVDRQFGTTDVFVMLKVADIDARYVSYYGSETGRQAA